MLWKVFPFFRTSSRDDRCILEGRLERSATNHAFAAQETQPISTKCYRLTHCGWTLETKSIEGVFHILSVTLLEVLLRAFVKFC